VNQLLLLSEMDAERLRVEPQLVAFDELVTRCAEMFEAAADAAGLSLVSGGFLPVTVAGNPQHLRQLVNNLLDNAIKFTPAPGRVDVSLALDEAASEVKLRVADTGAGIPEQDLPRIFERFFRGDRAHVRDGSSRGTGLGLSICQMIAAGHGGSIRVESQPGGGSLFEVTLPATRGPFQVRREGGTRALATTDA
jgi:signal transduction histidine kinase